jgi:hypothetical protein
MIRRISTFATLVLLVTACSRSGKMQRGQQQYQTVQEGSASGVTSTINGPGETPAPLTDTNADTTTNFTIPTNPNPLGNSTAGTVAGSIPSASAYPGNAVAPVRRQTQPRTDTQGMTSAPGLVVTDTIGRAAPPMPKQTQSETDANTTTDTATTDTQTSTSSDSNAAQPAPKKKTQQPPPPPPTDTTGTHG